METKNIVYKNFNNKINLSQKKKLNKFLNINHLIKKYPLLNSLKINYDYSFKKKELKKYKKYSEFNVIGMGGSILGSEAIYNFLNHKIKKNFTFLII